MSEPQVNEALVEQVTHLVCNSLMDPSLADAMDSVGDEEQNATVLAGLTSAIALSSVAFGYTLEEAVRALQERWENPIRPTT